MNKLAPWNDLIAGKGCPFCMLHGEADDYMVRIRDLSVSTLWLSRNQTYRGYALLIFSKRHVTGLEHLTVEEHGSYMRDLKKAGDAIFAVTGADHMNYATLGNVIPHLHYHVIPRYRDDLRWGGPIWTSEAKDMVHTSLESEEAYAALAAEIRGLLAN